MDRTTKSISSSCNNDGDGAPEETGMWCVLSDLQALTKLYGLLQRLDENETSKALLKKLLDDASRQALLRQAKALTTTASDSVIPFPLGLTTPKKTEQEVLNNIESETVEQVLSDLEALTSLYRLLHKGPADENLDEASRALLLKILEDATQEAVRRQAKKMLSGSSLVSPALERKLSTQSVQHADLRLRPVASPRPSLLASERSRRLDLQPSIVSRRSGLHVDGAHRRAPEEPRFARLGTNRSSRTALPARHRRPSQQEQRHSSLSLHRFPVAGTPSRHGTVPRSSTRLADRRHSIRRSSGHGDRCLLERSSWRSVSGEMSLGPSPRLRGRDTPRHKGAESSSSVRLFERMDSGLSVSTTSRHGVEHARRGGVATPERSSSSNTVATIQSRIRPSSTLLTKPHGRQQGNLIPSADMYSSMSSGSRSSGAASLSVFPSPAASPASRAFDNRYYYSPPVTTAPRGIAPPVYAPKLSRSMRRRRRQEILEKRVARLRMLKDKIATMFHHRHDHHHHHQHHLGGGQEAGPSSRSVVVRGAGHLTNSPWQYLTSMFHRAKGKDKNNGSRAVAGVQEKRHGGCGGGHMHALFDAVRQHLKGKRKAPPAGMKLRRKTSMVPHANKMHWWQRLRRRRGMAGVTAGSRSRRRSCSLLGHGKAGWL